MRNSVLPSMAFELPQWQDRQFAGMVAATQKLAVIGKNAGRGSDRFQNACRRLLDAALKSKPGSYLADIREPIDARACTFLLSGSREFAERVVVSRALLDQLSVVRTPMSRLTLSQLIRAFFVHFDKIAEEDDLEDWCQFLQFNLARFDTTKGSSELKTYAKEAQTLFSRLGPQKVVQYASSKDIDFDEAVKHFGLTGYADGRYLTLCRYQYYLKTLREIPVGAKHPILSEICKSDVANAPYSDKKLLGHAILELLIDRTGNEPVSQDWQSAILTIAGDPRVPKSHQNYQKWWALLGEQRVARMRGWLSRFDLKLFLKILEQSAKDANNADMDRMFVSRKIFMEGLLDQGLVVDSRLILSTDAVWYLKRNYDEKELPDFARVESTKTSMIYLNIANRVHMLEGSHSFRLKLMDKMPSDVRLDDYGTRTFRDRDLRTGIGLRYVKEYGDSSGILELTHDVHLNWQHHAIGFFKTRQVNVAAAKVIAKNHYRLYKEKFGIS